jgi:hypothetical protein
MPMSVRRTPTERNPHQVENASDPFFKSRRQDEIPTPQFKLRYV